MTHRNYTVEKIMLDLTQSIGTYEYRLMNECGLCVATICCEDLALRIRDLLNNDTKYTSTKRMTELLDANLNLQKENEHLQKRLDYETRMHHKFKDEALYLQNRLDDFIGDIE